MLADIDLSSLVDFAPQAITALLAVAAAVGLVLCMVGRKLIRTVCAVAGLAGGGAVAYAMVPADSGQQMLFIGIITGAVVGLVVFWLLFRVWMGLMLAVILGLGAPMAGLVMHDNLPPVIPQSAGQFVHDLTEAAEQASERDPEKSGSDVPSVSELAGRVRQMGEEEIEAIRSWWEQTSSGDRYTTMLSAGVGALVGLVVGLIAPQFTAALASSLLGAIMLVSAVCGMDIPRLESVMPQTLPGLAAAVGLITIIGWALQWIVFRRKADK